MVTGATEDYSDEEMHAALDANPHGGLLLPFTPEECANYFRNAGYAS